MIEQQLGGRREDERATAVRERRATAVRERGG